MNWCFYYELKNRIQIYLFTELGIGNNTTEETFLKSNIIEDSLEASLVYVSKQQFLQIKWNINNKENICSEIDGFQIRSYLFNGINDEVTLDTVPCNQRLDNKTIYIEI